MRGHPPVRTRVEIKKAMDKHAAERGMPYNYDRFEEYMQMPLSSRPSIAALARIFQRTPKTMARYIERYERNES